MAKMNKLNWLSVLRGLTILLVVMNHVRLLDVTTGENYEFIEEMRSWFLPLRIPTFVFVSGALLYYTRLAAGYSTKVLYADKLVRVGLPFIFCTCLGNIAQILFNGFVKHPHEVSPASFLFSFVAYYGTPWPHRWYLPTLLLLMLLYPVYTVLIKQTWTSVGLLLILLPLSTIDFLDYTDTNWLTIFTLNQYLPYFFLGILVFKHGWWKVLSHKAAPFISCALYTVLFMNYNSGCVISLVGIAAMISVSIFLDKYVPAIFSSFRNYIFQIYLFGIAFQAFVELILWRRLGCPGNLVACFYILNVLVGLYAPVLLSRVVEKIPCRTIRLCFGLK